MAVFKIEKNKNYTIMSNHHLRDKELSYKAKGLLSFMLSLPEDWNYSINGLVKVSKEGKKAIRAMLEELEDIYEDLIINIKDGLMINDKIIFEDAFNKIKTDLNNIKEETINELIPTINNKI